MNGLEMDPHGWSGIGKPSVSEGVRGKKIAEIICAEWHGNGVNGKNRQPDQECGQTDYNN